MSKPSESALGKAQRVLDRWTAPPARVAITSTPRSGNSWLRYLLAGALRLEEISAHHPDEVPWEKVPKRVVIQCHWPPTLVFHDRLLRHGFRPVVLARHPLDVLLSILQFAQRDQTLTRWLDGVGEAALELRGVGPTDPAFLEFAAGPASRELLSISPGWWQTDRVLRLRFEELVADPVGTLEGVCFELALPAQVPLTNVVAANTIAALRRRHEGRSFHFWQGRPGMWRSLLPAPLAEELARFHADSFRTLGYACRPDQSLTVERARRRWEILSTRGAA